MNRERKIEAVATWISEHGRTPDNELEDTDALAENIVNDLFPEALPKYITVKTPDIRIFGTAINEQNEQGYRLAHIIPDRSDFIAVMSLSSKKYEGITNLTDVPPEDVDEMITHDWEILETFSKKIRMVLRE